MAVQIIPAMFNVGLEDRPANSHIFIAKSAGTYSFSVFQDYKGENRLTVFEGGKLGLIKTPVVGVQWAPDGLGATVHGAAFEAKGVVYTIDAVISIVNGKWATKFTVFKNGTAVGASSLLPASAWTLKSP